jgi:hypothetical protein
LVVHEWGVQMFDASGSPMPAPPLPSYFHAAAPSATTGVRVSDLPADGGERDLPILHFYGTPEDDRIPLALSVGFTEGSATRWMPQVDELRSAQVADSAASQATRRSLMEARRALTPSGARPRLPDDPTRQLTWNALTLTRAATQRPPATEVGWVGKVRAISDALWVSRANETERFVFYEARTRERVALQIARGSKYSDKLRHFVLTNTGAFAVHDVLVIRRERDALFVVPVPAIPAGASAGFALEEHRIAIADANASTRASLRKQLIAARGQDSTCVMMRDPAVPVEKAIGYSLFPAEADALLDVWGAAMFEQPGTTIVYREDPAYLDQVMPVSIFTDMFHWVELHRAGLALWQKVVLP